MNTVQKYAGKGNSAQNPSPTVENRPQNPLSPDERDMTDQGGSLPLASDEQLATYQQDVESIQTRLLELVDDYCGFSATGNPVEVINELLHHWLTSPAADLAAAKDQHQLRVGLSLVNFLTVLQVHLHDLHYFTARIEVLTAAAGKEVSND
jgi:hypothetical protein